MFLVLFCVRVLSFETMLFISKKFGMCKHVKWKIVLWSYFGVLCVYLFFFLFCFRGGRQVGGGLLDPYFLME
jgi:hypothetical protein